MIKQLSIAALALLFSASHARSETVRYVNEACVEDRFAACINAQLGNGSSNRLIQNSISNQIQYYNQNLNNAINMCRGFADNTRHACIREINIPTAAEVSGAIREGNDQVLAAWLASLEATGLSRQQVEED